MSKAIIPPVGTTLKDAEKLIIEATLQHTDGNVSVAAKTLAARGGNSSVDFRVTQVRTKSRMIIWRHIVPAGYSRSD